MYPHQLKTGSKQITGAVNMRDQYPKVIRQCKTKIAPQELIYTETTNFS